MTKAKPKAIASKRIQSISDLTPDPENANLGTERGAYMLETSLSTVGAVRSVAADKDGMMIGGNKTMQAAADLGFPVKEVHTTGKELVVVVRDDLDLDSDDPVIRERSRKAAYFDNRTAEVGLAWDTERLLQDAQALDLSAMFRSDEIEERLRQAQAAAADLTPFNPSLNPDSSSLDYNAEDIDAAREKLGDQFKRDNHDVALMCPHCGKEFYVRQDAFKEKANRD